METHYKSMTDMFGQNPQAKRYFDALPAYVREQISTRAESVNTYSGLRDYAENLLRGDD